VQRDAELRNLQAGRSPAPKDAHEALELMERELPQSHPHVLSQLVEPKPGTPGKTPLKATWAVTALPHRRGWIRIGLYAAGEAQVRAAFAQGGAGQQGDWRTRVEPTLEAKAVMHELACTHPVANAFLLAQYGKVRKVDSEEELARTGAGPDGGRYRQPRLRHVFACRAPDQDLAFGEATRKRRMIWCEQEVSRLDQAIAGIDGLQKSLGAVSRMFWRGSSRHSRR
jgi:hypothetical protein